MRLPVGTRKRIRALFLGYTLFNTVFLGMQYVFASAPLELKLAAFAGSLAMAAHWFRSYRQGRHSLAGDVVTALAIGLQTAAIGSWIEAVAILYVSLQAQSFYDSWRRTGVRVAMYFSAFLVGILLTEGASGLAFILFQLPNLILISSITHLLSITLYRQEQAYRQQSALANASAAMVLAVTPEQICEASLHGVLAASPDGERIRAIVAMGRPGEMRVLASAAVHEDGVAAGTAAVGLQVITPPLLAQLTSGKQVRLRRDDVAPGALPDYATHKAALITPLLSQSELRGILILAGENVLDADLGDTVRAIGTQLSLALEGHKLRADLLERMSEARSRSLVQNSSDLILVVDARGAIRFQTPSVTRLLGYPESALAGADVHTLLHPDDAARFHAVLQDVMSAPGATATVRARWNQRDGAAGFIGDTAFSNLLDDPAVGGVVLNTRDVTAEMSLHEELRRQAFHDSLTELANRALFEDRVEHAILAADRRQAELAVLFLDVDDFKKVNDSLGHHAGDELLVELARRLAGVLRKSDTVARLGGDEFAVLLEDIRGQDVAMATARRIQGALAKPVRLMGRAVGVQCSIGVALRTPHDGDTADVLRDADLAMYAAKAAGKDRCELFHEGMRAPVLDRLELESDLRAGITSGAFFVEYQPIVRLSDGAIVDVEALVRWRHPRRGVVPPLQFIPAAEETGLIVPIGDIVLRKALEECRQWGERLGRKVGVSVNFSARQFQEASLVDDVARALRDTGVEPSLLTVEITESVLMRDADASATRLAALRGLGVRIAIDDFGTGYSSLSYLTRLPADVIKIDRSFVDLIRGGTDDPALPRAIVALASSMGLGTVAEGIEHRPQLDSLRAMGCELGQGYYFARPLPAQRVVEMIAESPAPAPHLVSVDGTIVAA